VKGLSENISVRSIVGRYLEHSRIFYFENACQPQVWMSSADWMPRNFFRRVEIAFPIEDGILRDRIQHEILERCLEDNVKARLLQPNGEYLKFETTPDGRTRQSQQEFMDMAMRASKDSSSGSEINGRYARVEPASRPEAILMDRAEPTQNPARAGVKRPSGFDEREQRLP
jgi:polyphosphate kinase